MTSIIIDALYSNFLWPGQLGLQDTPIASLERVKTLTKSVLDMTLNNPMERL